MLPNIHNNMNFKKPPIQFQEYKGNMPQPHS